MVASKDAYQKALSRLEEKGCFNGNKLRAMLQAQYGRPRRTITATKMAMEVGYKNFNGANLNYGKLAKKVARELDYQPPREPNKEPQWYRTLSTIRLPSNNTEDGHYEFVMIPELAAALEELGWVKMNPVKTYRLLAPTGEVIESTVPGKLGGNSKDRIYGRLDCTAANAALPLGYADHRVFFANEDDAIAAGYRPCHRCMQDRYSEWKRGPEENAHYPWKLLPQI